MKTIEAFLSELNDLDVSIWAEGDKLHCDAPKGLLTSELRTELAERKAEILQFLKQATYQAPPILPIPRDQALPLSFAQQRLWFIDQLEGCSKTSLYNIVLAMRLDGPLHHAALKQSLQELVQRHEILQTCFPAVNGNPIVQLLPVPSHLLSVINLPAAEEQNLQIQKFLTEALERPFDLSKGPLFRATLLQLGVESHILLFTIHHIIFDGWSNDILLHELATLYNAFSQNQPSPLAALPIQYIDFAYWQRQWLSGEVLQTQLSYWQQQLADVPLVLEIPSDLPRPSVCTFQGSHEAFELSPELTKQLKSLSQQAGVTLFVTALAAFGILMGRYSGQENLLIGSVHANRNRTDIEPLIGFFINTLALRIDLSGNPSFVALLKRVQQMTLEAYAHQELPFEKIVESLKVERDLTRNPLVQVALILQNTQMSSLELDGLALSPLLEEVESNTVKFDVEFHLIEVSDQLIGRCIYYKDIFEAATIKRMLGHFQVLLASIAAQPEQPISTLSILSDAERHQLLVEWNDTATDYPQDKCIHQLFEAQVDKTPDAVAVVFDGQQLSYQELNARANQLAHHLQSLGVKPEVLVGICVERSLEMMIGLLGILKAGGAYVPLDPTYPQVRLAFMLEDAQVPVLLTMDKLIAKLPKHQTNLVNMDTDREIFSQASSENLITGVQPNNLAYVMYTSGSTGKPKGVMIEHHNVLAMLHGFEHVAPSSQPLIGTSVCPFGFDVSVWEFFSNLCFGGMLHLVSLKILVDPESVVSYFVDHHITCTYIPPALLSQVASQFEKRSTPIELNRILVGVEPIEQGILQHFRDLSENMHIVNGYGPTETTICATFFSFLNATDLRRRTPIGIGVHGYEVYLVDSNLQPVPIGVTGEILIGGAGLSRGYLNRLALTQEKFIPNIFSDDPTARLYKTGDLGRYFPDGNIEYLGRIDHQVKIRGFRIELGEIEAVLNQDSTVREAVVIVREDQPGNKRLVAYIVSKLILERLPIQSVCVAEFGDESPITLNTEDISYSGVGLVGVPPTCQTGQRVRLCLQLPNIPEKLCLTGQIAWCQGQRAGVQFTLNLTEKTQLGNSVAKLFDTLGFMKVIQRTSSAHLREVLKEKLPDYMVPASFVFLTAIPLTPNGKIDRKALPKPDALRLDDEASYIAPETEIEHNIATVWQSVLHINKVGIHDNFFDLGGNSLQVIQVQSQLVAVLNQEVPAIALFQYPTIYALAHYLEDSHQKLDTFKATKDHADKVKEAGHRHHKLHKK